MANVLAFIFGCIVGSAVAASTSLLITGSTGVLGSALVRNCLRQGYPTLAGYRDEKLLELLLDDISRDPATKPNKHLISHVRLDHQNEDFEECARHTVALFLAGEARNKVLINNAAICVDDGLDSEVLKRTLLVNTITPTILSRHFATSHYHQKYAEKTVINVSSGDGELLMLHSSLQEAISSLTNFAEFDALVTRLTETLSLSSIEVGFGTTSYYSLSKALLNSSTKLLHNEAAASCRTVSVCPGNFASAMSTPEELLTAWTPDQAAASVFDVAMAAAQYPGGKFYRHGREISW